MEAIVQKTKAKNKKGKTQHYTGSVNKPSAQYKEASSHTVEGATHVADGDCSELAYKVVTLNHPVATERQLDTIVSVFKDSRLMFSTTLAYNNPELAMLLDSPSLNNSNYGQRDVFRKLYALTNGKIWAWANLIKAL